jgi:hypothetical protein
MAKKKDEQKLHDAQVQTPTAAARLEDEAGPPRR